MASVSVSHLIIFIAAMLVAASVAGLLTNTVDDLSNAIEDQGLSTSDEIRADITIINDAGADMTDGEGNYRFYVKNTGSSELSTDSDNIDLFINGIFTDLEDDDIEVMPEDEDNEVWGQNDVVEITTDDDSNINDPGENRVKIVADGAEDTFVWEEE